MPTIRTHYDNLKVARNAPPEVIRAAYRVLAQKYHPDVNPDNPQAARIMSIINTANEVLSDPVKRREHDEWIEQMEREATPQAGVEAVPEEVFREEPPRPKPQPKPAKAKERSEGPSHFQRYRVIYFIAAIFVILIVGKLTLQKLFTTPAEPPLNITPPPVEQSSTPATVRPATAPNGRPWPEKSGYVEGYAPLAIDGYSEVTIDNSHLVTDMFVKLYALGSAGATPVRVCLVKAGDRFTLKNIRPGRYDVRYQNLDTGAIFKSEPLELSEAVQGNNVQSSQITFTLLKDAGDASKSRRIDAGEFAERAAGGIPLKK
ncbi:MAG: J domain-containing protein [Nitrospirota bacterium]|nr:J domain-containing protein [Nitrospirota bacterium]